MGKCTFQLHNGPVPPPTCCLCGLGQVTFLSYHFFICEMEKVKHLLGLWGLNAVIPMRGNNSKKCLVIFSYNYLWLIIFYLVFYHETLLFSFKLLFIMFGLFEMHVLPYFYLLKSKVLKCYLLFNTFSNFFQMYECNTIPCNYIPFFPPQTVPIEYQSASYYSA